MSHHPTKRHVQMQWNLPRAPKLMPGDRIGELTIVDLKRTHGGQAYWIMRCECSQDRLFVWPESYIPFGQCRRCVMRKRKETQWDRIKTERAKGPDKSHLLFGLWQRLLASCDSIVTPEGDQGIVVCYRWWSFDNFIADMRQLGNRWRNRIFVRIDDEGDYWLDNCMWARTIWRPREDRLIHIGGRWKPIQHRGFMISPRLHV